MRAIIPPSIAVPEAIRSAPRTEPPQNLRQLTGPKVRQAAVEPLNQPANAVAAGLCRQDPAGWPRRGWEPVTLADIRHRQVVRQIANDMPATITGGK
jgi:hypothetical protein